MVDLRYDVKRYPLNAQDTTAAESANALTLMSVVAGNLVGGCNSFSNAVLFNSISWNGMNSPRCITKPVLSLKLALVVNLVVLDAD